MKIIVIGPDTFTDYKAYRDTMEKLTIKLNHFTLLVASHKNGTDKLTSRWTGENLIPYMVYHHDSDNKDKRARRLEINTLMARDGNALIAFDDGLCPFVKDIIGKAKKAGLIVKVVRI